MASVFGMLRGPPKNGVQSVPACSLRWLGISIQKQLDDFAVAVEGSAIQDRVDELLDRVGLGTEAGRKYPHEFSGGQRQRISIARALATQPRFLICDEPTSALDVSIQAQILQLLDQIREQMALSMIFITHDLRVAAQVCDRLAVMRYGEVVETGPTAEIFADPQAAYTKDLLAAVPGRSWRST